MLKTLIPARTTPTKFRALNRLNPLHHHFTSPLRGWLYANFTAFLLLSGRTFATPDPGPLRRWLFLRLYMSKLMLFVCRRPLFDPRRLPHASFLLGRSLPPVVFPVQPVVRLLCQLLFPLPSQGINLVVGQQPQAAVAAQGPRGS